ncbi:ABC transporter ATP-binding protein [Listeria innocua]
MVIDYGSIDTDSQFVGLTVAEDIAFSLENEMIEQKEMQEAVNFWAKKTNLLAQLDKRPQDLSGGQKQRISLARIFATDPDLFVLDEPTTGMDEESRNEFYRLLRHSAHVHGKSVLMITHDHEDIKQYADRQIRLVRKEDSQWRCFHMNS